jgi:hypothetical protein
MSRDRDIRAQDCGVGWVLQSPWVDCLWAQRQNDKIDRKVDSMNVEVRCDNFLSDNRHVYAIKANRKKIAIIHIQVTNRDTSGVQLLLGSSKLFADGEAHDAEDPEKIVCKLSEFTWDFLLYSIVDFHPVTAIIDMSLLLTGPIYNRRLKRQLALLSNEDLSLSAGESKSALLAFRCPSQNFERLQLRAVAIGGVEALLACDLGSA